MNKFLDNLNKYFSPIVLILLVIIFLRTCGDNGSKTINKRIDTLSGKVDTLQKSTVTKKDLIIEGLKNEKRMIQSTDRKMMDVNRQSEIDQEIELIHKSK